MKFVIERSNEALFSHSGLALAGSLIKKSGLAPLIDEIDPKRSAVDFLSFQRCRQIHGRSFVHG